MSRIANEARAYRSRLRADQADATRARILDATVRVMATGIASLSVPAVAREAGVSVPTVYRHFATKAVLLAAVYPHLIGRSAFEATTIMPASLSEFRELVRRIYARLDTLDDLARAAMASPSAEEARRLNMPNRIATSRRFMATMAGQASDADRERIARLMVILTNSAAMRVWRDYFGSSAEEAAADVDWILRAAIAAAGLEIPA